MGVILTPPANTKSGACWQTNLWRIDHFAVSFDFRISSSSALPADGLCFVVQTRSFAFGATGGGMGYSGLSPSAAICLDTYDGFTSAGETPVMTMNYYQNGAVPQFINSNIVSNATVTDGNVATITVAYNITTGNMTWSLTHPSWPTFNFWRSVPNLPAILGSQTAWVGVTAATGGQYSQHEIV